MLQHPTTQPDQVLATFIADDDDGNLANGTPHYDAFCVAATNHGFTCPEILVGVFITHEPLSSRTTEGDAESRRDLLHRGAAGSGLAALYRVNGGPFTRRLTPTGGPDEYRAIPGLAQANEVEYYLRARDVAGNTKTHPPALAPRCTPSTFLWYPLRRSYDRRTDSRNRPHPHRG